METLIDAKLIKMSNNTVTFTINFGGNAVVNGEKITKVVGNMQGVFAKLTGILDGTTQAFLKFNQLTEGIQNAVSGLDALSRSGLELNSSMTDLAALTGVTGDGLRLIERSARDLAKTFGGSAAQAVESYKLILSQLGPDIAQTPEALAAMGESVATLSKTMGGDTTAAADVLTTAMNQFGVSMEDPSAAAAEMARMMNVMAAAAQAGSAELPAIKEALQQSGMAAAAAGVSFEETNAALQVLDQRGRKASEGGVALRNVLTTLSQGRFLPQEVLTELDAANIDVSILTDTSRSLADRLEELSPLMNDTALMTKLFGRENANAAIALISGVDALREYTEAVTDTSSAEEQAAVVMQSRQEQMARMTASIEDYKIRLYDILGGLYPALKILGEIVVPVSQLIPLINFLSTGIGKAATMVKALASSLNLKAAAMRVATVVSGTYRAALAGLTAALGSARIATIALQASLTLGLSLAIQGIITLIQHLTQKKREEKQASEEVAASEDDYSRTLVEAKSRMSVLTAELRSFNGSKEEERRKVEELNATYGNTFGTYQTVSEWYDVIIAKSDDYVKMLANEAKIKGLADKAAEQSIDVDKTRDFMSNVPQYIPDLNGQQQKNPFYENLKADLEAQEAALADSNARMQALVEENARIRQGLSAPLKKTDTTVASGNNPDVTEALEELDAAFAQLETRNAVFGQSQNNLNDKINATRSAISGVIADGQLSGPVLDALIAKYRELLALKREASGDLLVSVPKVSRSAVSIGEPSIPEIRLKTDTTGLESYGDALGGVRKNIMETQTALGTLGSAMSSISSVVGDGAGQWLQYGANVFSAVGQAIGAIAALIPVQQQENSVAAQGAIFKSANSAAGIPVIGWITALAAVASMTAALLAVPKFASGGLAFGPTLGLFGEYPGASHNPEVVAPLDRLQSMLRPDDSPRRVRFEIEGRSLVGLMEKMDRFNGRTK